MEERADALEAHFGANAQWKVIDKGSCQAVRQSSSRRHYAASTGSRVITCTTTKNHFNLAVLLDDIAQSRNENLTISVTVHQKVS